MPTYTITGGGGLRLHVEETGNPAGRSILFIHGFAQCWLAWKKQMTSNLAGDFRLVALDIRGHGLSDKPPEVYGDSQLWAADIDAVITTLGLAQPLLVGWSYGGAIICDYVRYYGEEQIGGINLVGAVSKLGKPSLPLSESEFLGLMSGFFSNEVETSAQTAQALLQLLTYRELPPEEMYFFLGVHLSVPPFVRKGLFSRTIVNDDVLAGLRKPVLITHGEQDPIVLPEAAKEHAAAIAHARTSFYPNAAHMPFWENAERFNRELREFKTAI